MSFPNIRGSEQHQNESGLNKVWLYDTEAYQSDPKKNESLQFQIENDAGDYDSLDSGANSIYEEEPLNSQNGLTDLSMHEEGLKNSECENPSLLLKMLLAGFIIFDTWLMITGILSGDCCERKCRLLGFLFITSLVSIVAGSIILILTCIDNSSNLSSANLKKQKNKNTNRMSTPMMLLEERVSVGIERHHLKSNDIPALDCNPSRNSLLEPITSIRQSTEIKESIDYQANFTRDNDNPTPYVMLLVSLESTSLGRAITKTDWIKHLVRNKNLFLMIICMAGIGSFSCGSLYAYKTNTPTKQEIEWKQNQLTIVGAIGCLIVSYSSWLLISLKLKND